MAFPVKDYTQQDSGMWKTQSLSVCTCFAVERRACGLKGLKPHQSLSDKLGRSKAINCSHFLEVIPMQLILFATIDISSYLVLIIFFKSQNIC